MPLPASSESPGGWRGGEAWPARQAQAAEGSEVSPVRTDRPHVPWGGRDPAPPARAADAHSTRSPSRDRHLLSPPRLPGLLAPASGPPHRRPREDGEGRSGGAAGAAPPRHAAKGEGRPSGRAAALWTGAPGGHRADPRMDPRPRPPGPGRRRAASSSPHLQAGLRCRPRDKSVQLTRRGEGRRSRSPAHHPRPPASPCVPESARESP